MGSDERLRSHFEHDAVSIRCAELAAVLGRAIEVSRTVQHQGTKGFGSVGTVESPKKLLLVEARANWGY